MIKSLFLSAFLIAVAQGYVAGRDSGDCTTPTVTITVSTTVTSIPSLNTLAVSPVVPTSTTTSSPPPDVSTTPAPASTTTSANGTNPVPMPAPGPTPSGTTSACGKWFTAIAGDDDCPRIEQQEGVSFADFRRWNPAINEGCTNLVVGTSYCVAGPAADGGEGSGSLTMATPAALVISTTTAISTDSVSCS